MTAPFPWQIEQWRRLWDARRAERLPHAFLFSGPKGGGISEFAQALTASLICDGPLDDGGACRICRSCVLYRAGNHPDVRMVSPDEDGETIKIDQVRDLVRFVGLTGHYDRLKIILLDPADTLNRHAANSLLKTLEEPPAQTLFLLVSHTPGSLPLTIRSRCQHIGFRSPSTPATREWLAARMHGEIDPDLLLSLAEDGPLAAAAMIQGGLLPRRQTLVEDLRGLASGQADPVEVAARWSKLGLGELLPWLLKLVGDLIKLKYSIAPSRLSNPDLRAPLEALARLLDLGGLFGVYDRLLGYARVLHEQPRVATLNLLEEFTIKWAIAIGANCDEPAR